MQCGTPLYRHRDQGYSRVIHNWIIFNLPITPTNTSTNPTNHGFHNTHTHRDNTTSTVAHHDGVYVLTNYTDIAYGMI
jgi:hypothetical protein